MPESLLNVDPCFRQCHCWSMSRAGARTIGWISRIPVANWVSISLRLLVSQEKVAFVVQTDTLFAASLGIVGEIFLPGDARTVVAVHVRENKVGVPYAIGCEDITRGHRHEMKGCMIPSE